MLQWLLVPVGLPLSIRMETIVAGNGMCTGMTSRPMPSPGINPIRNDLDAIGDREEVREAVWVPGSESDMGFCFTATVRTGDR